MPPILTSVAFVVCQVKVVDIPLSMELGFADKEAVGDGGGGGGGGGGGAALFLQAPNIMMAPRMNTRVDHLTIECFTISSLGVCTHGHCANALRPVATGQHLCDRRGIMTFGFALLSLHFCTLFPTPIWLRVASAEGQLLHFGTIRQHAPDLLTSGTTGLEDDV